MFNLNDWIANRGLFESITIEGIELQIVSLSDELKEMIPNHHTHELLVDFIATYGLSHGRQRICDNESLRPDIPVIFALPEFNVDCEPSVKEQIAQAVCELSGLPDLLTEQQLKDEAAADLLKKEADEELALQAELNVEELKESGHINGDGETPDVNLAQLNDDAAYQQ